MGRIRKYRCGEETPYHRPYLPCLDGAQQSNLQEHMQGSKWVVAKYNCGHSIQSPVLSFILQSGPGHNLFLSFLGIRFNGALMHVWFSFCIVYVCVSPNVFVCCASGYYIL